MNKNYIIAAAIATAAAIAPNQNANAQAAIVRNKLQDVAIGKTAEVKKQLPELLAEFPNDPGVQFLHAVILDDATRAMSIYQRIVNEHAQSEWADDAQWRIVQYHAIRRDAEKARKELAKYRTNHPTSEFLLAAAEIVKATVGFEPQQTKNDAQKTTQNNNNTTEQNKKETTTTPQNNNNTPTAAPAANTTTTTPQQNKTQKAPQPTTYAIQTAGYASEQTAQQQAQALKQKRLRADVTQKNIGKEPIYAVTVGDYPTREAAEKAIETVAKLCQCEPFVIEKQQ